MQVEQNLKTTAPEDNNLWPFAFVNGDRTAASTELMKAKHKKQKDDLSDMEEGLF